MSNKHPKQEVRRLKKELSSFEAPIVRAYIAEEHWSGAQIGYLVSRMTEIQQAANQAVAGMVAPPAPQVAETITEMYDSGSAQARDIEAAQQRVAGAYPDAA